MLLLDSTVIVDEDVGAFIFGVGIASSALVARTEVALLPYSVVELLVDDAVVRTDGS